MSTQTAPKVHLFLKNEQKTVQQQIKSVKLFLSSGYKEHLAYEDDHVIIKMRNGSYSGTKITRKDSKCKLSIAHNRFDELFEFSGHTISNFNDKKLQLFIDNYDHFVNAFRIIQSRFTPIAPHTTGITFGSQKLNDLIIIEKTDEPQTIIEHNLGYYVSDEIKNHILSKNSYHWKKYSNFDLEIRANHCTMQGDTLKFGIQCGTYKDLDGMIDSESKECFIENFSRIVDAFKMIKDDFEGKITEFNTSNGIVI